MLRLPQCGLRYFQWQSNVVHVMWLNAKSFDSQFEQIERKTKPRKLARQFTIGSEIENGLTTKFNQPKIKGEQKLWRRREKNIEKETDNCLVRTFILYFFLFTFIASFDVTNWKLSDFISSLHWISYKFLFSFESKRK